MTKRQKRAEPAAPDSHVPDPAVWAEIGISPMSGWRWDQEAKNPESELAKLGWPPPIKIRGRNFRSRHRLEQFKANAQRKAIQDRARGRGRKVPSRSE
jgi:hypothetical protein